MRKVAQSIILVTVLFLISACNPLARPYRPMSSLEQGAFDIADRYVYPEDVRKAPEDYQGIMVAWPGVIIKREIVKHRDWDELRLVLEHHYYDWVENSGFEDERIFYSSRGEGIFRTSWRIKNKERLKRINKSARAGNLLIVYGIPAEVNDDGSVVLASKYLRVFNKKYISTNMMDYGRPVQPVKETEIQKSSAQHKQ